MNTELIQSIIWKLLPWLIALVFYFEAGRRTWQVMFMSLPERSKEPLALAVKANQVPVIFMALWAFFWCPFMVVAWMLRRYQTLTAGRTSPLDIQ